VKVTTEKVGEAQVALNVEVDPATFEDARRKVYRRLVGSIRIPGFRPGKAPIYVVERFVGREAFLEEALNDLAPRILQQVQEAEGLDILARSPVEVAQLEPLTIRMVVQVRPKVGLGNYRSIRLERPVIAVTDEEVDQRLEDLRRRYATLEPVDRPAEAGDRVVADVTGWVGDEEFVRREDYELTAGEDSAIFPPGFGQQVIGRARGETVEFTLTYPEDFQVGQLAGKEARFRVTVNDIKVERLPELDDEFARTVEGGFETLDQLREHIRSELLRQKEEQAEKEYRRQVLEAVIAGADVEIPPVMVEQQVERMVEDMADRLAQMRLNLVQYLRGTGRTEEQLREEFRPQARRLLLEQLVLDAVAEAEGIEVTEEELRTEAEDIGGPAGEARDQVMEFFTQGAGREHLVNIIRRRRALERLVEIAASPEPPAETEPTEGSGDDEGNQSA
jgi:trigger factor